MRRMHIILASCSYPSSSESLETSNNLNVMLRTNVFFVVPIFLFVVMLIPVASIPIPVPIKKRVNQASTDVPGWCGIPCKRNVEQMKRSSTLSEHLMAIRDEPGGGTGSGGQGVNCPGQKCHHKRFNWYWI